MLAGADQVQILALNLIHHGVHFGKAHHAGDHIAADHKRGNAVGEALVDHKITGIGGHGTVQAGDVAHQVVETVAGYAAGRIHVDAVKALHNVGVVGNLKIGGDRLTKPLHLHIAAIVRADGHAGVNDLGNDHHDLVKLLGGSVNAGIQLCHTLGVGLHCGIVGVDLGLQLGLFGLVGTLFQLPVQRAVGLAQLVALCLERVALLHGAALFSVQRNGLVHQGQLGVLELLADVFLYCFGIFPYKSYIKHSL